MILDTTFLIDLARRDAAALEFGRRMEATGQLLWIPAPALFELWECLERADRPGTEGAKVRHMTSRYTTMGFDTTHAEQAGRLSGLMVRRGLMMDPIDAQVAGMALAERLPVVTRNVRDFQRVEGLQVVTY